MAQPSLSFLVDDKLIPLDRRYVPKWGFLIDILGDYPELEEIPWTYTDKAELERWLELNRLMLNKVHNHKLLSPLSSVWRTVDYMRPVSAEYMEYFYVDQNVPQVARLTIHRQHGRWLREKQTETNSGRLGFMRAAMSDKLPECIHSNMYLWNDPIEYRGREGWASAVRWHTDNFNDSYKERLLNIDFLNICTSLIYDGYRRMIQTMNEVPSNNYDSLRVSYYMRLDPQLTYAGAEELSKLFSKKLKFYEVPFDLIAWNDVWAMTDNKWYYLNEMGGPQMISLEAICAFLERVDKESFQLTTNLTRFFSGDERDSLYLALAGQPVAKPPPLGSIQTSEYVRIGASMAGSVNTPLNTEKFSITTHGIMSLSANVAVLYDSLIVAMCSTAPTADYLGLKRFTATDKKAYKYELGTEYTTNAFTLVQVINQQCIAAATQSPQAIVKSKDIPRVVKYMLTHIGSRALSLMCDRLLTLSEEGEDVPLGFIEEALEQVEGKEDQGFITLP